MWVSARHDPDTAGGGFRYLVPKATISDPADRSLLETRLARSLARHDSVAPQAHPVLPPARPPEAPGKSPEPLSRPGGTTPAPEASRGTERRSGQRFPPLVRDFCRSRHRSLPLGQNDGRGYAPP